VLSTAIQEQLGLRLELRTEPSDALIIDKAERPTPNQTVFVCSSEVASAIVIDHAERPTPD
jgi:hypothetical protein